MENESKNSANNITGRKLWQEPENEPNEQVSNNENEVDDLTLLAIQVKKNLRADFERKLSARKTKNT